MAGLVPHRVERAVAQLEALGFKIKIAPHAKTVTGHTAGSAEERANDIQQMFSDDEVKAIISFIGGNHSNQLLKHLDFRQIALKPKIFVGYSDITVLHFALQTQCGFTTFYGPAALTQFAENPSVLPFTWNYFERAVMKSEPIGKIQTSDQWTDEILDWFEKKDLERARTLTPNSGSRWLRTGTAEGPLLGGCLSSMMHLRGTKYWPNFSGSLFFWEIPESNSDFTKGESVTEIDAQLADLELSGIFDQISGMIVGRPFGYTNEDRSELQKVILERTTSYNFPILTDVDIGHTDPMITVPLGVKAKIDSQIGIFEIIESGVSV
jgi:muramoyltetrapeptide carboxypeptidase